MKNSWRSLGAGAVIMMLTIGAYLPALRGGFIWDDDDHVTKNRAVRSVDGLKQIWSSLAVSRYYPLTLTSFWMQHRLWGLHPLPYHAVNIALHAVNAVLLWTLLRRLGVPGAWVAAAVWAVHPVNVETVAWVTELKNTQSGLFFLLALLAFLRFEDRPCPRDYVLAVVCGIAAMLSKPSTVVLPGVLLLCTWWRRNQWTRQDLLRVTPLVAVGVGMSLLAIVEQRHHIEGEGVSGWTLTAAQRLVLAGHAVWFYAGKLLWPANICFIYPRWNLPVHSIAAWTPLAGLGFVAGTLWRFRSTAWARAAAFGLGYFVVALLPVLGFFDIYFFQFSFVADHFQYLASLGLIALLIAGVSNRMATWHVNRRTRCALSFSILLMLGVSTWQQAHVYKGLETLWRDTLAKNPGASMAHNNLGIVLSESGRTEEAVGHWQEALRLKADCAEAHINLGAALWKAGRTQEANDHWREALRIKPNNAEAYNNLGDFLFQAGRIDDAMKHYKQALRINPEYAEAHNNLGIALARAGRVPDAIDQYAEALRISPNYVEAHYNLGNALREVGKTTEAIREYEQVLRIKPGHAEAHNNLGIALAQTGRMQEAVGHYEQALRTDPDYAEAHNNLGSALAGLGRLPEAIEQWEQALRIKPDYTKAHFNLGVALEQTGKPNEGIRHYEEALRLKPDFAEGHKTLGYALLQQGRAEQAATHLELWLRATPNDAEAHSKLGVAFFQGGRIREAVEQYEQALRIKPGLIGTQNNLAWLLATVAPAEGGDPVRALGLAEHVCELTDNRVAAYLDTLAVAYAAADRFTDAMATASKAVELARSAGQSELVAEIEARLQLYRDGHPYRQLRAATARKESF